ncbi:MAG: helix-turn-helix domain-containing protein [Bacillota bacterium]
MENGRQSPSLRNLKKIAKALDISLKQLLE